VYREIVERKKKNELKRRHLGNESFDCLLLCGNMDIDKRSGDHLQQVSAGCGRFSLSDSADFMVSFNSIV